MRTILLTMVKKLIKKLQVPAVLKVFLTSIMEQEKKFIMLTTNLQKTNPLKMKNPPKAILISVLLAMSLGMNYQMITQMIHLMKYQLMNLLKQRIKTSMQIQMMIQTNYQTKLSIKHQQKILMMIIMKHPMTQRIIEFQMITMILLNINKQVNIKKSLHV